jgi:hypothetical protein
MPGRDAQQAATGGQDRIQGSGKQPDLRLAEVSRSIQPSAKLPPYLWELCILQYLAMIQQILKFQAGLTISNIIPQPKETTNVGRFISINPDFKECGDLIYPKGRQATPSWLHIGRTINLPGNFG